MSLENHDAASPLREIRARLNDARARGRWTVTSLAQRSGLGRTTVSNALNGGLVTAETLASLAGPLRLDAQELLALLRDAKVAQVESSPKGPNGDIAHVDTLGCPINELDPWALEVHRAIQIGDQESTNSGLPTYVRRDHDDLLTEVTRRAVHGLSQIVMLVGPSSTGKTRACWEAIQCLPANWKLWHPIDPDRPSALIKDLRRVGPCTVIWLNESQHYLLSPYGEGIAAGLRSLLYDKTRTPVLVLGTIWPEYHEQLMREPTRRDSDPYSQARHLLAGRDIAVPTRFDRMSIRRLLKESDPRLVAAASQAEDGMITQYLAGAPELQSRYERSTPGPKALLEAAMDARGLGHPLSLPLPFLAAAAEGYFTETQWDLLADNWLEQALAFLTEPVRGARGALTPVRRRRGASPSSAPAVPVYRLADYLEQLSRSSRRDVVPEQFWTAAVQNCEGAAAEPLAQSALQRGLLKMAVLLSIKADTIHTLTSAANALSEASRLDEALPLYLRAISKGEKYLVPSVAHRFRLAGRHAEADEILSMATFSEFYETPTKLANRLALQGDMSRALELFRSAADDGNRFALRLAANRLVDAGRLDEAIQWYAECGDNIALHIAAYRLGQAGRLDEALTWYRRSAEAGNSDAYLSAAHQLAAVGRLDEALTWFERAANVVPARATRDAAWRLALAERIEESLIWFRRSHEGGSTSALSDAAGFLMRHGREEEARQWYEESVVLGDSTSYFNAAYALFARNQIDAALRWYECTSNNDPRLSVLLARELASQARITESLDWYSRAADQGSSYVLMEAAQLLVDKGDVRGATDWYRRAVEVGETRAISELGHCLIVQNGISEGLEWFERAHRAGDRNALHAAAHELASLGQLEEALSWCKRACEAGQSGALHSGAVWLAEAGRFDEAADWFERAASEGHVYTLERAAQLFLSSGRNREAINWYHRAAMSGVIGVAYRARLELQDAGLRSEAHQLRVNGWSAADGIETAWTVETAKHEYGLQL